MNIIWEQFLSIVKEEAGSRVVDTWLKAVVLERYDAREQTVFLSAPNTFVEQWISSNYMPLLQQHLKRLLNVIQLNVVFVEKVSKKNNITIPLKIGGNSETALVLQNQKAQTKNVLVAQSPGRNYNHIKQGYVFDSFVVGPSNSLAYAAAHAVTEKPGKLYNPLFLYGSSGLGKTHLLYAIGNRIKQLNDKALVVYQTADRFINEFINAIRFDHMHKFQEKYKSVDVLLVDDIQFLSNKEQTQEAFFHIFNVLYDRQKQIVFSSDTPPKGIDGLAERLRSRLEWGLVADVYIPTIETKIAIVKKKAELHAEIIPDDVAYFIASRVFSNIRELEGALIRVCAFAKLTGQQVSIELAKKVLIQPVGTVDSKQQAIECDKIARVVCSFYDVSLAHVRSVKRSKELVLARHVAMYFMKQLTNHSLQEIGHFWGRKDHSTVLYAVSKISSRRQNEIAFGKQIEEVERIIIDL